MRCGRLSGEPAADRWKSDWSLIWIPHGDARNGKNRNRKGGDYDEG